MAMKKTRLPWENEVNEDWSTARIKYNYYLKGRIGWQGLKADEFIDDGPFLVTGTDFKNGRVNWETCYHISNERYEEAPEIHVQSGDLLVTKDGTIGKTAYIEDKPDKVSLNSHLLLMRPLNELYSNRFLFWVINSPVFEKYYNYSQTGTIMASLSQEKISNFIYYMPDIGEQNKIASYLDDRCSRLDELITEAEKSIEEYKELKQAVIFEAVTKGLDENAPLKDSGIKWIGDIPSHWLVKKFKYVASVNANLVSPDDYMDYQQIAPDCIEKDSGRLIKERTVSDAGVESWNQLFHKGQLIYSKIRPILNKVIIAPYDGLCSADMYPLDVVEDIEFVQKAMLSRYFVDQVGLITQDRVKMPKINKEELANIYMAIPPRNEQVEIVKYLVIRMADFDEIIDKKQSLIEDLQAYKKSLIYEVVTGKRRVV